MRHLKAGRKLGRNSAHRRAMFRNMVTSLIMHGRITTTDAKAKELRRYADRMITLGKQQTIAARRRARRFVCTDTAVARLFADVAPRFAERPGGYTRIVKVSRRHGDCAPLSVVELTGYVPRVYGAGNAASRVEVRAVLETWVQVTGENNELLLTRILRPGDVYHVPDRPGLVMMTGNAGGLAITVGEVRAPSLGPVGAVRRGVLLDPERLLAGTAVAR